MTYSRLRCARCASCRRSPATLFSPSRRTAETRSGYPIWNFGSRADDTLHAKFAGAPKRTRKSGAGIRVLEHEGFLAETEGTRTFPWRVFVLADAPGLYRGDERGTMFSDVGDAKEDAQKYIHEIRRIKAGEKLSFHMAPGGGFVVMFSKYGVPALPAG